MFQHKRCTANTDCKIIKHLKEKVDSSSSLCEMSGLNYDTQSMYNVFIVHVKLACCLSRPHEKISHRTLRSPKNFIFCPWMWWIKLNLLINKSTNYGLKVLMLIISIHLNPHLCDTAWQRIFFKKYHWIALHYILHVFLLFGHCNVFNGLFSECMCVCLAESHTSFHCNVILSL